MQAKNSKKSYFYAGLTVLFWSTVATAFKFGLSHLSPANLLFYSSLTSLIFFAVLLLFSNKRKSSLFSLPNLLKSALFGFLNPFLYYLILFEAYKLLPAQIAQPLNYTWVIVVTILMAVFMNQKLQLTGIIGLLISFGGVIVLSSQGSIPGLGEINIFGVVLAISSSLFWGIYWLLNVRDKRDDVHKLFLNFLFGTIFIFIYCLFTEGITISFEGITAGIYIGLFEMGITFFVWLKALQYAENTAKTGNIIYISPFLSLVFIALILGEPISILSIAGLCLIVLGILLPKILKKSD